jgi:hypothetical protein
MLVSGRAEPSPTLDVDEKAQDARCARDHRSCAADRQCEAHAECDNAPAGGRGCDAIRFESTTRLVPQYVAPPGDHPPTLLVDSIPETTTPRPEPGRVESRLGQAFSAACHRGI